MSARTAVRRAELALAAVTLTALLLLGIVVLDVVRFHLPALLEGEETLDGHTGTLLALSAVQIVVTVRMLRSLLRQLAAARLVRRLPKEGLLRVGQRMVAVVAARDPRAFCSGLLRPRIHVTEGAVALLSADELAAVVEHEAAHARRLDPLRLLVVRAVADGFALPHAAGRMAAGQALAADLAADAAALAAAGSPRSLAIAMSHLGDPAPERVDQLLGRPSSGVPGLLLACAAAATAGLAALGAAILTSATDPALPAALLVVLGAPAFLAARRAYVP